MKPRKLKIRSACAAKRSTLIFPRELGLTPPPLPETPL